MNNGNGPPPGMDPYGQSIPVEQLRQQVANLVGEGGPTVRNDPAYQPPTDPLRGNDSRKRALEIIYRDIPLISIVGTWSPITVRSALAQHTVGYFDQSGQLADSIIGDARVQATLSSRMTALFGRPVIFRPANDSRAAKEVLDVWQDHWPALSSSSFFREAHAYSIMMGWSDSQIWWDTSGKYALPHPKFWHPRYEYYHWPARKYVALTQDGVQAVIGGDGKWIHHTPRGSYRGWMYGAIRAVAEPWLLRHYAFTYMARFAERHGMPMFKAYAPFDSDTAQRAQFNSTLVNLGSETVALLPRGTDPNDSYDIDMLEAQSTTWEIFPGLIDRCDLDITLALLFQNLTTEIKGGSFAAVQAHMEVRQGGVEDDNMGWRSTLREQIARPFSYFNFGDPELAPWTEWDVTPIDRAKERAALFQQWSSAISSMKDAGMKFKDPERVRTFAKSFGLELPEFEFTPMADASTVTADLNPEKEDVAKEIP